MPLVPEMGDIQLHGAGTCLGTQGVQVFVRQVQLQLVIVDIFFIK